MAAPTGAWAGAVLRKVQKDLAGLWPAGLTVLTGDDLYHLDRAQSLILDQLVPDRADAFGVSIVGDEPITAGALVGAARSLGMFASRRIVFLRDVAALEGEGEPLTAYAARPPRESWIIVRAPKLDRKRKLHKALAESGICLTFRRPASAEEMREFDGEVQAMAASRGVTLESDASRLLIDVCGSDLNRVDSELEKLSIWLNGSPVAAAPSIDVTTLRQLVAGSELMSGWELADAVTAREPDDAIAAARRLIDAGDEPIRTLGGLASRARSLLKAKAMQDSGMSSRDVIDAARAWYFRDALARGLKRYTLRELLAMPAKLYEADRTFKSRGIDKGAVLETLVIDLTVPRRESR